MSLREQLTSMYLMGDNKDDEDLKSMMVDIVRSDTEYHDMAMTGQIGTRLLDRIAQSVYAAMTVEPQEIKAFVPIVPASHAELRTNVLNAYFRAHRSDVSNLVMRYNSSDLRDDQSRVLESVWNHVVDTYFGFFKTLASTYLPKPVLPEADATEEAE
jgi:hypothetical protein